MALNRVEVPVGYKSSTPAIIKHLVRFGRRLREHRIHSAIFPSIVDDEHKHQRVLVGRRIINVFDNGDVQPSLVVVDDIYDRSALSTHFTRWHAFWLNSAGACRRHGWLKAARADLNIAIAERRRMTNV